jgi:pyruvyltransferase
LAAAGSVLDEFPDEYNGVILGSGFIRRNSTQTFPRAAVLAVRGELTRKKLRRGHEVELGDPGLLASLVMAERRPKQYALGVIPHYLDRENENFVSLKKNISGNARFIDVRQNPRAVFDAIDQCEKIVSSSLHGLIVSDSLGIPNAWVESKNLPDGRFKFDDYYSAMGLRENPLSLKGDEPLDVLLESCSLKPQDKIIKIKNTLDGLWRALRDIPFR